MPDIRQARWEQVVSAYLESVQSQQSEPAKSQRFLLLLNELFGDKLSPLRRLKNLGGKRGDSLSGVQPGFIEDYVAGIEKYVKVKQKDRILRGQVDNLFGNLVIEFERDLAKTRGEAEEQLRRYVACLWSQEGPGKRAPYLCIATDGVRFAVYSPTIQDRVTLDVNPEDVRLEPLEEVDLSGLKPQEVYFWLDRYFLRREILSPKTENIVKDFGLRSHAFQVASQTLLSLWNRLKGEPEFSVVYEGWEKYLLIVYGTSVADEELFIRHTYLATLAKLMAWSRLTEVETSPDRDQVLSVLEGQFFTRQAGIENFLEEDFFSWIARKRGVSPNHMRECVSEGSALLREQTGSPLVWEDAREAGVETARMLLSLLQNYNLRELSEDVLKSLYQELVDPRTRHDLGEYYTPDWLAHRMVQRLLDESPEGTLLDPACGSGTFLYLAVREKKERLGDSARTLSHILDSVVGVDIHPLAVIVAKTNYILALGDLLKRKRGRVSIPIYLSDTIRLPERWADTPMADYEVEIDGQTIYLPQALLESPEFYDEAIEAAREFAVQNVGRQPTKEQFANYLRAQHPNLLEGDVPVHKLFVISKALRRLIESRRDTIWAFVLKNIYKPLFLKGRFDFVVGNPPWLSFRYAEPRYQEFLKEQITKTYGLLSGRGELITHMELATLFFLRAADLYLRDGGTIAFVLPRSLFSADQHDDLRQGNFKGVDLRFEEVWDLEGVDPLFNVPSCVLFAEKESGAKLVYPIPGQTLSGELGRRNAALKEAKESLAVEEVRFALSKVAKRSFWSTAAAVQVRRASYYKEHFRQGATIVPRSFWFVEVTPSPLGFNPSLPPLETAERAKEQAKDAYKGLVLKGNVESRFLYATLLSTDLLPFGHLDYRLVVLPIEPSGEGYELIAAEEARKRGFFHLAGWLEEVEREWGKRRSAKAERIDALEWLDYRRKLTSQNPQAHYKVMYPDVNRVMLSSVVHIPETFTMAIGQQEMSLTNFIVECGLYCFETDDADHAYYLCAVLNSSVLDRQLAPFRRRRQKAQPHVHKKIFDVAPIPQFDPSRKEHLRLAELGQACTQKVAEWLQSGGPGKIRSTGKLRSMVREMLADELGQIDELVEPMLRAGT